MSESANVIGEIFVEVGMSLAGFDADESKLRTRVGQLEKDLRINVGSSVGGATPLTSATYRRGSTLGSFAVPDQVVGQSLNGGRFATNPTNQIAAFPWKQTFPTSLPPGSFTAEQQQAGSALVPRVTGEPAQVAASNQQLIQALNSLTAAIQHAPHQEAVQARSAEAMEDAAGRGGGGGRTPNVRSRNLFSARGLAPYLGGVTAGFAAIEALRVAGDIAQAVEVEEHPERQLRALDRFGSDRNIFTNDFARQQAQVLASNQATKMGLSAVESIPILGSFAKLGDAFGGFSGRLEDSSAVAQRNLQGDQFLHEAEQRRLLTDATISGDPRKKASEETRQILAPFQQEADRLPDLQKQAAEKLEIAKVERRMYAGMSGTVSEDTAGPAMTIEQVDPALAEQIKLAENAAAELEKQKLTRRQIESQTNREFSSTRLSMAEAAETSRLRAGAANELATFTPGSEARAREFEFRTKLEGVSEQRQVVQKIVDPPTRAVALQKADADEKAIRAQNSLEEQREARNNQQTIISVESESYSARLRAGRQFHAAELADFDAATAKILESLKGREQSVIDRVTQAREVERRAHITGNARDLVDRITSDDAATDAAGLRAKGLNFDAEMGLRKREQAIALGKIEDPGERAIRQQRYNAENATAYHLDARQQQNAVIGLQGELASAQDRIADRPLSARVDQDVAAARIRLRNADPRQFAMTQQVELANLAAERHDMLGVHGGGFAAMGTSLFMPGDALGLGGRAKDAQLAQQKFDQGEKAIKGEKPDEGNDNQKGLPPEVINRWTQLLNDIAKNTLSVGTIAPGQSF